jgi:uncharacterized protein
MNEGRFRSFEVNYLETDLWIGVNPEAYSDKLVNFAYDFIVFLRTELDEYILKYPEFKTSLVPLKKNEKAPEIIQNMYDSSKKAEVGPMAAVAGAFSEFLGRELENKFHVREIIIENGGDIYLNIKDPITVSVYAGESPLSEKVGLEIPAEHTPCGICTSSGTVGHSFSFGKADAVMIACKNTADSDAFATSFCNKVKQKDDISTVLNEIKQCADILSALIICKDKIGASGQFKLKVLS